MGITYTLVNHTKKEEINFHHLPASKKLEIVRCIGSSAVTTWYMLNNIGDQISFTTDISGTKTDWPFEGERESYVDVTEKVLKELVENEILKEDGYSYQDELNPECYTLNYKIIS